MSGLSVPRVSPLPAAGRGTTEYLAGLTKGPAGSTPFPSPRVGAERSHVISPGLYLGMPNVTEGETQGTGESMETEGTGQIPSMSTFETGASGTMTDHGSTQPGAQPSPQ